MTKWYVVSQAEADAPQVVPKHPVHQAIEGGGGI